jgi:acyl-CoA thioester hydrolase
MTMLGDKPATCWHHDLEVSIEPGDIDFMGHVNNASYLKWVQAAVMSH